MTPLNTLRRFKHPFPFGGSQAVGTLRAGGMVLLPTANLWQIVVHPARRQAVHDALRLCPPSPRYRAEMIFADVDQLRAWCPGIHPRLTTLLSYHRRPLTCIVPAGPRVPLALLDENAEVAVRLASDSFVYRLCEDVEHPLLGVLARGAGAVEVPTRFGAIRSDVLRRADHIVKRRVSEVLGTQTAVVVRFNETTDEVEFV